MERVLISNDHYNGKYVAMKSIDDNSIVGSGMNPSEAIDEARQHGVAEPFIMYIPDTGMVHIY